MLPDDDEGVISKQNTQRIPVSLIKHLQKAPSLYGTRNTIINEVQSTSQVTKLKVIELDVEKQK